VKCERARDCYALSGPHTCASPHEFEHPDQAAEEDKEEEEDHEHEEFTEHLVKYCHCINEQKVRIRTSIFSDFSNIVQTGVLASWLVDMCSKKIKAA